MKVESVIIILKSERLNSEILYNVKTTTTTTTAKALSNKGAIKDVAGVIARHRQQHFTFLI
jgi:hypothetical protein